MTRIRRWLTARRSWAEPSPPLLGKRKAVIIGASVMALGHFMVVFEPMFYLVRATIALGNGLFLDSLHSQINDLCSTDDPRRGRTYNDPECFADIMVSDPAKSANYSTCNAMQQQTTGVRDMFLNGVQVLRDGKHTGVTPDAWSVGQDGRLPRPEAVPEVTGPAVNPLATTQLLERRHRALDAGPSGAGEFRSDGMLFRLY